MKFRQFNSREYPEFMYYFTLNSGKFDDKSKNILSDNLFGWGDEKYLKRYNSDFKLELIYG